MPKPRKPLPPQLQIGDPFDFWIARANRAANRLGLAHVPMAEALAVVRNALGDAWLRDACEVPHTSEIPFKPHRLGDCLTIAGDDGVVELVELALYLRRLHDVPGLADVLPILKKDYWAARQQLAFAYRFRELGAANLNFEPEVGTNRGDLMFDFGGRTLVVESFYPRYGRGNSPSLLRLFHRIGAIGEEIGHLTSRTLRVSIRLRRTPNHSDAKALEAWVIRVAREGIERLNSKTAAKLAAPVVLSEDATDLAAITIEDITGVVPDPDFGGGDPKSLEPRTLLVAAARTIAVDDAARLRDEPLPEGERGTRIRLIDAPNTDAPLTPLQVANALVAKLQRKVSQIGAMPSGAVRLLLVNVPWLDDVRDPERTAYASVILKRIDDKIVRGRSRMAGVLAVNRVWTGKRQQYRGVLLEGADGQGLGARVGNGLNDLEGTSDLLARW